MGANISVKSFVQTGTPGAVTNNGFTISSAGNVTLLSGKYIAASNAARISITTAGTLTTGGNAMGGVTLAAAAVCGDNLTFIADKLCTLILNGNFLDVNGKTISGNSATNRLLICANNVGLTRTVTVNGGSFANCDFQDIAFANGGADLDLSAITGGSGNCGGNSMSGGGTLTFTAPSTQTFASTGGNWSDIAKWTSRVPLPQDIARFQPMSAGQTITVDIPRLPDTDFSGCGASNLPSVALTTTGLTYACYGSLNLTGIAAGGWSCTKAFTFAGRSNASLTSNGQTLCSATAAILSSPGNTLTINDALYLTGQFAVYSGTFSSLYSITAGSIYSLAGSVIALNNNLVTILSAGGWVINGTVNAGTSTILLSYTGASAATFAGGTNTYNDIQIAPGSGVLAFSGAFTFRNMTMSSAGTRSIVFTKATTYTQTGDSFLSGTAGNLITIASSGAGEAFTLSKASGLIASNFLAIKDSIATGGATWLAGYNSTNISGNTGWHFNSPASGAGSVAVTGVGVGKALCRAIGAGVVAFTGSAISNAKALCKAIGAGVITFASTVTASLQASAIGAGIIEFTGAAITSAKALASGIGTGNIDFAGTGGAEAICKAIGAGTVRFLATVFPTVAVWDVSSLFKATERYVGQYFKASKRRK